MLKNLKPFSDPTKNYMIALHIFFYPVFLRGLIWIRKFSEVGSGAFSYSWVDVVVYHVTIIASGQGEEILIHGNRLCFTHCRELLFELPHV